jgi:FHA domain
MLKIRAMDPRDERLRERIFGGGAARPALDHPAPEAIAAHAADELAADEALEVTRHLAACADGSCAAILRAATAGAAVARAALYDVAREEGTDASFRTGFSQSAHVVHCRDDLWAAFEAIARDEQCSTDWLLGEAMKVYTQLRARPTAPGAVTLTDATPPPPVAFARERNTPTLPRSYLPKAPASSRRGTEPVAAAAGLRLTVIHAGVRYEVDTPRFVVGRGPSDLAIDDPGVSRRHALIERAADGYVLVDLGSTNGVEFEGVRIHRRQIADGDRVRIGGHEIEFVLR